MVLKLIEKLQPRRVSMSVPEAAPRGFSQFALDIRSFERTLYRLVASSFVLSGVAAIAKATPLDAAQIATITLIGTIAGSAGVLTTYLAWPQRPDEEQYHTILFDPVSSTKAVRICFAVSLVTIILYAVLTTERTLTLLLGAVGIYFFFRGMVTAGLATRRMESQQRLWNEIGSEGRERWIAYRQERELERIEQEKSERQLNDSTQDSLRESDRFIQKTRRDLARIKAEQKRERWRKRRESVKRFLIWLWDNSAGRLYRASIKLRERIAPGRLLTPSERSNLILEKAKREEVFGELQQEWAVDTYHKIRSGQLRSSRDEASGIEVFRDRSAPYLILNDPLSEENTRNLVDRLAFLRTEKDSLAGLSLLIEGNSPMTEQARMILEREQISFYWVARSEAAEILEERGPV
jgi:hypothetical protein